MKRNTNEAFDDFNLLYYTTRERKKERKIQARNIQRPKYKLDARARIVHGRLMEGRGRQGRGGRYYKIIGIRECYRVSRPAERGT